MLLFWFAWNEVINTSRQRLVAMANFTYKLQATPCFSHSPDGPETAESAEFPPHMTPLMLACHDNDYEMIRLLLSKGYNLDLSIKQRMLNRYIIIISLIIEHYSQIGVIVSHYIDLHFKVQLVKTWPVSLSLYCGDYMNCVLSGELLCQMLSILSMGMI